MSFTVESALKWWARELPGNVAISVDGDNLTFAELYAWSARVGEYLLKQGVRTGERVMMCGLNTIEYAALIVGAARIGAIGVPLTFRSTAPELQAAIASTRPVYVFTDPERHAIAAEELAGDAHIIKDFSEIGALRAGAEVVLNVTVERDAPLFIIGTSGSTGRSKYTIYSQFGVMTYACEFALMEPRCARGSAIFSPGPFSSASGYLLLLQYLVIGASVYIESRFQPERALEILINRKITTFLGVPIFFERIAVLPEFAAADLSSLHFTQVAGARVNMSLLEAWRAKGVTLRQAYGCTEAGGGWAARDDVAVSAPEKCGRGGIFNEYAILGEDGEHAPPGTVGEILFRGAAIMSGYWNDREGTAQAFLGDWFRTSDMGKMDEAGNLTFVDRLKDIIISGGLNVSAAEVERVIHDTPHVEEVAVIAVEDPMFGETPLAVVYGDRAKLSVEEIIGVCNKQLASYKVPRYVVVEPEHLPRLPSGKISKPALRERYKNAAANLEKVR